MFLNEEHYELNGHDIMLRGAAAEDGAMLVDYLKTVCGETPFLLCYPDEVHYTDEQEAEFIKEHNEAEDAMLILAFVDGQYAGNCSFTSIGPSRRSKHRADIGIAVFLKYTGFGLGRLMLTRLIKAIKECGFEQAELTVVGGNERAYHLYESFGFRECGRIPNANRYDDGTYADDIHMVLNLKAE